MVTSGIIVTVEALSPTCTIRMEQPQPSCHLALPRYLRTHTLAIGVDSRSISSRPRMPGLPEILPVTECSHPRENAALKSPDRMTGEDVSPDLPGIDYRPLPQEVSISFIKCGYPHQARWAGVTVRLHGP
jgi:hypothetical protein